jgi:hypothetical protein
VARGRVGSRSPESGHTFRVDVTSVTRTQRSPSELARSVPRTLDTWTHGGLEIPPTFDIRTSEGFKLFPAPTVHYFGRTASPNPQIWSSVNNRVAQNARPGRPPALRAPNEPAANARYLTRMSDDDAVHRRLRSGAALSFWPAFLDLEEISLGIPEIAPAAACLLAPFDLGKRADASGYQFTTG